MEVFFPKQTDRQPIEAKVFRSIRDVGQSCGEFRSELIQKVLDLLLLFVSLV